MQNQDIDSSYTHALKMQNSTPAKGGSCNCKKTFAVFKYGAEMAENIFRFPHKRDLRQIV